MTENEYDQSFLWELEENKQVDKEITAIKERLKGLFARFRKATNKKGEQ